MSIRSKISIAIIVVFVLFVIFAAFIEWAILYPRFLEQEREAVLRDLRRTHESLVHELQHLGIIAGDWAEWDDTYRFAVDGNNQYILSNLVNDTFIDNKLNIIAFYDESGRSIWAQAFDYASRTALDIGAILPAQLDPGSALFGLRDHPERVGIHFVRQGPMFVAVRRILKSDNAGPSRGTLVMARFLDERMAADLKKITLTELTISPLFDMQTPANKAPNTARSGAGDGEPLVEIEDAIIRAGSAERDIEGHYLLHLGVSQPRDISRKGAEALMISITSLAALGFVILGALTFILGGVVIKPLARLKSAIVDITTTGNTAIRLTVDRADEIGVLAREFNALLGNLHDLNRHLEELVATRTAELEEQKTLLRAAIDTSPDLIFVKDRHGRYLLVNQAFANAYGRSVSQLTGATDDDLAPYPTGEETRLWSEQDRFVLDTRRELHRPLIDWLDANGRRRWFNMVKRPLVNAAGTADAIFGYCIDITTMKTIQDQLEEKNRDLETALSEISMHAKEMESFTSSVAQDLVTPLNRIIETLQTFTMNYDLHLDHSGRKLLASLTDSAHGMYRLIDDLNWLNRAAGWRIIRQPVDLGEIARDFAAYHTMVEPEREIRFEIGDRIIAHADRILMKVVIQELLENAIIHTRGQAMAEITFAGLQENGEVTYVVRDNGPGIDPGEHEAIFHPFIRGAGTAAAGGTGIGLATVRRIVERHGGAVWADNDPAGGARFSFTLGTAEETID